MRVSKMSPGLTGTMGPSAPESTRSPARRGEPRRAMVRASQHTALSGLPRQAAPAPTETGSPRSIMDMPHRRRSNSESLRGELPRTKADEEALSATVSTKRMFQLAMRLPTTSMAGSA